MERNTYSPLGSLGTNKGTGTRPWAKDKLCSGELDLETLWFEIHRTHTEHDDPRTWVGRHIVFLKKKVPVATGKITRVWYNGRWMLDLGRVQFIKSKRGKRG